MGTIHWITVGGFKGGQGTPDGLTTFKALGIIALTKGTVEVNRLLGSIQLQCLSPNTLTMSAQSRCYGSGFSDLIKVFTNEELGQFLFGSCSSSSPTVSLLDWAMTSASAPPSPPALANFSQASSDLLDTELVPDAAQTFYAFIEGQYDPCLFVEDPFSFFVNEKDSPSIKPKSHLDRFRRRFSSPVLFDAICFD
ncbi:hypothetical protein O181_122660 [Austropuccinia psidii MF-1]|uniref:Uncharacterized protein n=1 Tax=Austropuccinia psidii MF-1 TaxID=1389203 RepID=A0A9Q3KJS4_9BASI|nr:hypothetical protein [Austropuccinia psidii MF-1]